MSVFTRHHDPRQMVPQLLQIFTALSSISLSVSALQGRDDRIVATPACLAHADVQSQGLHAKSSCRRRGTSGH